MKIKKKIYSIFYRLPVQLRQKLFSGKEYECSVCNSKLRKFISAAPGSRSGKRCPVCKSLERHRIACIYLTEIYKIHIKKDLRVLHFAPESGLKNKMLTFSFVEYLTADLMSDDVDLKLDICKIDLPDNRFDFVFCSHVLEHVEDDRQAMKEIFRVLAPGGSGLIMVPMVEAGPTIEDPNEKNPNERLRRFGQIDHVRLFGMDIVDRLQDAGFMVTIYKPTESPLAVNFHRFGMREEDIIFEIIKPGE